mmetsp:Transcript_5846/g.19341  ORF Transcript_5846/g.19341 Transcript_5846/m.19341 type:complete len:202 (+) Transcript_5846:1463-2068(+)
MGMSSSSSARTCPAPRWGARCRTTRRSRASCTGCRSRTRSQPRYGCTTGSSARPSPAPISPTATFCAISTPPRSLSWQAPGLSRALPPTAWATGCSLSGWAISRSIPTRPTTSRSSIASSPCATIGPRGPSKAGRGGAPGAGRQACGYRRVAWHGASGRHGVCCVAGVNVGGYLAVVWQHSRCAARDSFAARRSRSLQSQS